MHIGQQEWRQVEALASGPLQSLYHRLADRNPDESTRAEAAGFLHGKIAALPDDPGELPESPQDLLAWMENNTRAVHARYVDYLQERKAGAPRRYFSNRA